MDPLTPEEVTALFYDPTFLLSEREWRLLRTIRDRERELQGHRKALSAIATAIDPVGPITPEEILAAIISDRELRRERDEFKASCVEAENAIRACPALREWGPATAQHLASRVNNVCHLYDSAVYTITQLNKERDELQRKLDELERK